MAAGLISVATGKPIRRGLALTGELSLSGRVLPVGGIKEKTIAARRSALTTLIFPEDNRKDFEELPDYLKEGLKVHFAKDFEEAYSRAFGK